MARIVLITDTWDAMTGDRVYRKGISYEKAINKLESERNLGQFDPDLLDEFVAMIREDLDRQKRFVQRPGNKTTEVSYLEVG